MKLLKIKNIKKVQNNSLLYDIETKKNHNFFANGVLVHNSSATYIKELDGTFRVCSRNLELKDTEDNVHWQMARLYNIKDNLKAGYAIQGEISGPGIQGNPAKCSTVSLCVFNVFDLNTRKPLIRDEWDSVCANIKKVHLYRLWSKEEFSVMDIDTLQNHVNGITYNCVDPAEGLVFRGIKDGKLMYSQKLQKMLSVKIINQNYKD
jgi:hypothetical protein